MLAPNTTNDSISSGRCARPSAGRHSWATNWCQCPMPRITPPTHHLAHQSLRDDVG